LPFAPPPSRISQHYHKVFKSKIPKVICGSWSLSSHSIIMAGHEGWVSCIAFSPDGRRIASGSRDCTIRLWDAETGAVVGEPLRGHGSGTTCLAFSPDSRRIASGSGDNTIRIWDGVTGVAVGEPLRGHTDWVRCLAFSPDGHLIASGSRDNTIRLWDGGTGLAVGEPLRGHTSAIKCLAFSPDGRRIASGSGDNTIRLWDGETGISVGDPLRGHTQYVTCLAFSPDGHRIASGSGDNTLRLWDAQTGGVVGEPIQVQDIPLSIRLQSHSNTLFVVVDHRIAYNFSTTSPSLHPIEKQPVASIPDNPILYDKSWTLIRSTSPTRFRLPSNFQISSHGIHDGKIAYGTEDGSVIIIDCAHLL
jgi:WD40 repeat protein